MYHYTECGLKNVYLMNGFKVQDTPYGEGVSIKDVPGLHKTIADNLVDNKRHLTGPEFRFIRKKLELSQKQVAEILGFDTQTVASWEKRARVVKWADRLIRVLYRECRDGDAELIRAIDRLNELERASHNGELRLKSTSKGWAAAANA